VYTGLYVTIGSDDNHNVIGYHISVRSRAVMLPALKFA
jgi:hypothetical protein